MRSRAVLDDVYAMSGKKFGNYLGTLVNSFDYRAAPLLPGPYREAVLDVLAHGKTEA